MLEMEMKQAELVVDFGKTVSQKHNSLFFLLKSEEWTEGSIFLRRYLVMLDSNLHFLIPVKTPTVSTDILMCVHKRRNGQSQHQLSLVNSLFIPLQNRYKYISIVFSHKQEIFKICTRVYQK